MSQLIIDCHLSKEICLTKNSYLRVRVPACQCGQWSNLPNELLVSEK